jgi:hypothetical protein
LDAERFDTLARFLSGSPTRRGALRLLAGAALGGVMGSRADGEASAHNALPACKKKSGKAKKKCIKNARKHNATHATPPPPPPPPPPCQGRPDDTPCNGDGRCLNGVCNPKPTCGFGADFGSPTLSQCRSASPETCCSGRCIVISQPFGLCYVSAQGQSCIETTNCDLNLECVGYVCRPA